MRTTTLAALAAAGTLTALAAPATAYATTVHAPKCSAVVNDHINKTDNGHGTPSEWADLSLSRSTSIQCTSPGHYKVLLVDRGTLRTRAGAGTPNGTGGTIAHAVPGKVDGVYGLTVTGELAIPKQRDTSLSSTEYVRQLFAQGATVTGGDYAWTYTTRCEKWLDGSKNNDGQGSVAGNITGKLCPKPSHSPTASPSTTPTSSSGGGSSTPTTVPVGAPQTGDGTSGGGPNVALIAGGALMVLVGLGGGVALRMRRRGQHH